MSEAAVAEQAESQTFEIDPGPDASPEVLEKAKRVGRVRQPKANSQSGTPASETPSETPSLEPAKTAQGEVAAPGAEGEETPANGEEKPEGKPEWTLETLNEKAKKEGLTPEEFETRERLEQSERDRQSEAQRQLSDMEQKRQQRLNEIANLGQELRKNARTSIESEVSAALQAGRQPDMELITQRVNALLDKYDDEAQTRFQEPVFHVLDTSLLHPEVFGDTQKNREAIEGLNFGEKIAALWQRGIAKGRELGPDDKSKITPTSDWDENGYHKPSMQKALDDYKAQNPGSAPPPASGAKPGPGGLTPETYAEKLERGEEVSKGDIDAMVAARYLNGSN